jgi:hypothetical protein
MSTTEKPKTRITYKLEPNYDGKFSVRIYTAHTVETAQEGLDMIRSMYMLEDPDEVSPTVEVTGVDAVDLVFGLEK